MPDNKTVTFDASQYQLVPKVPTDEMLDAASHASMQHLLDCINDPVKARELGSEENARKTHASRYQSMLAAAPTPAAQSAGQEAIYQARVYGGWDDVSRSEFEQIEANERPKRIVYAAPVNGGERELGQVIDERDQYHDAAEKLADAIAKHFGVEIGEHSNLNCPWQNALDHIAQATKRAADAQQVGELQPPDTQYEPFGEDGPDSAGFKGPRPWNGVFSVHRTRDNNSLQIEKALTELVDKIIGDIDSDDILTLAKRASTTLDARAALTSPAKVGGDGREALTADEVSFVLDVYRYPGAKLYLEVEAGVWSRPERLGLVTCVGSYKWNPTSKLEAIIRAALSADGGEQHPEGDVGPLLCEAATTLPEGWEIVVEVENGYGGVNLIAPDKTETDFSGQDMLLSEQIRAAIDAAIDADQARKGE